MRYEITEEFADRMLSFFEGLHSDKDRAGVFLQMLKAWRRYKRDGVRKPLKHAFTETEAFTEYVSVRLN